MALPTLVSFAISFLFLDPAVFRPLRLPYLLIFSVVLWIVAVPVLYYIIEIRP